MHTHCQTRRDVWFTQKFTPLSTWQKKPSDDWNALAQIAFGPAGGIVGLWLFLACILSRFLIRWMKHLFLQALQPTLTHVSVEWKVYNVITIIIVDFRLEPSEKLVTLPDDFLLRISNSRIPENQRLNPLFYILHTINLKKRGNKWDLSQTK